MLIKTYVTHNWMALIQVQVYEVLLQHKYFYHNKRIALAEGTPPPGERVNNFKMALKWATVIITSPKFNQLLHKQMWTNLNKIHQKVFNYTAH